MRTAAAILRRQLPVITTVACAILGVSLSPGPCRALCGDDTSPQFVLNTCGSGYDRAKVYVQDAFNDLPVRNSFVRVFSVATGDTVAKGECALGVFERYLPPGTYVARVTHSGYREGESAPFVCPGGGSVVPVGPVKLWTRTVVLAHGWTGNNVDCWSDAETTNWKQTLENLHYNVFAPRMAGSAELGVDGTQPIPEQAEALADSIRSYGVESVYVVAHSFGGLAARWYENRLSTQRVVRLFMLATPNHGSGLAKNWGRIKVLISAGFPEFLIPSSWYELTEEEFYANTLEAFGAVEDLIPNSPNLCLLNQGDGNEHDWIGWCPFSPHDEVLPDRGAQYCTVTATTRSPGWYYLGGLALAGIPYLCDTSDGIVPWLSAPLWSDGDDPNDDRVRNYWDTEIGEGSHHLLGRDTQGIAHNVSVRDFVIPLLDHGADLPPSHWIPPFPPDWSEGGARCAEDRQGSLVALPVVSGIIEDEMSVVDTLAVEPTDSLAVIFTWFAGDVFLRLEDPQGALADTSSAIIDRDSKVIFYSLADPEPGLWKLHVDSHAGTPAQRYTVSPYVMSGTTLTLEVDPPSVRPGSPLTVRATAASGGAGALGADLTTTLLAPSGAQQELVLYDDGAHDDGDPDDGIYGNAYLAAEEGSYVATTDMAWAGAGARPTGTTFRQAYSSFAAVDSLDLAVVSGSTQVQEPIQFVDMPCHVLTAVTNAGAVACGSAHVTFDLEGAGIQADTLLALAPGQIEYLEIPLTPAVASTHRVHVRVSAADGRADENASNDEEIVEFLPEVGLPNLTISVIALSNEYPAPGETLRADITVVNNGTARTVGTFVDLYYDRDTPPAVNDRGNQCNYMQPLMPGETLVLQSHPFAYDEVGTFHLYAQVDPTDLCSESSNNDNVLMKDVPVPVETAFYAVLADDGSAILRWAVPELGGLAGFNVYRGLCQDGPFDRVNSELIPPCSPCVFQDTGIWPATEFWYELKGALAWGGEVTLAGPLPVRTAGELTFDLALAAPNPARQETWFVLDVAQDCPRARVDIYDVSGRLVRTAFQGPAPRGRHMIRWDLANASGAPVAAGVYFARAEAGEWTGTRKMVVVR